MMKNKVRTVGIIGAGPAGLSLASFLAMRGIEATVFDDGKRPGLLVGESLVPGIVPVFQRLGLEERVAQIGLLKPGVSFTMPGKERVNFNFRNVSRCGLPQYSYNVPRPAFDALLAERAAELGAHRVCGRARVEPDGGGRLRLDEETLGRAPWLDGKQPDLLVDSTGCARLFARVLKIPAKVGPRRDVSYFAHYEGFEDNQPRGQVIMGWLAHAGWAWRIPLQDRMSVGIVLNKDEAAKLGASPAQRLENAIDRDPDLSAAGANRRRVSEVVAFANYQLVSTRGHGPGWAMTGDAFGFIDPLLSPGLWLALHSAELLAQNLDDLPAYGRGMRRQLKAWTEMIAHYYSGRIFSMYYKGVSYGVKYPSDYCRAIQLHFDTMVACMACGATTQSLYGRSMLKIMSSRAVWGKQAGELAIR
jgi:flavin-dependent dehydrogenase